VRHLFEDDAKAATRIEEIARIVGGADDVYQLGVDVPVIDARLGYARWSATYDNENNPLIELEQPVVWSIFDQVRPGKALDAACGTGRHTRRLVELGHDVVGIDGSPEMLDVAKQSVPHAVFREGDLNSLPLESASVDLVVCALALEHVADLPRAISELARVLRSGGQMVLSDLHPAAVTLGGGAFFRDAGGRSAVVRGYGHLHGDFLRAFEQVGLRVRNCFEPRYGPAEAAMQGLASSFIPDAAEAAFVGVPGALIWELAYN
jgi:SAM-dependent methyltransferase